jgi:DNA repair exonuclease SbcCD nuclease subunit
MVEIYRMANELGCEFLGFGGDFCKTHRIFSYNVIGDVMDVICDAPLHTYACIGEHDLYGHSPNTYSSSTLAFIDRRCANIHMLMEPLELPTASGPGVVLHAKHEWEAVADIKGEGRKVDQSKLNILLCHELITNEDAPFDVTDTATLEGSPFDLVCSGDLHTGYEPHEVDGTWFCNPGAICRENIGRDIDRMPQVALIDIEKGEIPVIQYRRLECPAPGTEVFGESIAEIVRAREEFDGDSFADEMLTLEADSVDVHELIQTAGKTAGLSQRGLDYLATKRGDGDKEAGDER